MAKSSKATGGAVRPNFQDEFESIKSLALIKAIEIMESEFTTSDGVPIKPQKSGYMGHKAYEDFKGKNEPSAQPGYNDRAFVPAGDGKVHVSHTLVIRNISTIKSASQCGTLNEVICKDGAKAPYKAVKDKLNSIIQSAIKTGVAKEVLSRVSQNYFSGLWVNPRNIYGGVSVTIKRISDGQIFSNAEDFTEELYRAMFAPYTAIIAPATMYFVEAIINSARGCELFGSEAYIDKDSLPEGTSRVLVKTAQGGLAITPQRATYAIRSYDNWTARSPEADLDVPLAIHPTSEGERKAGDGAMSLIFGKKAMPSESGTTGDDHFVVANIMHGGLFTHNADSKEKSGKKEESGADSENN